VHSDTQLLQSSVGLGLHVAEGCG